MLPPPGSPAGRPDGPAGLDELLAALGGEATARSQERMPGVYLDCCRCTCASSRQRPSPDAGRSSSARVSKRPRGRSAAPWAATRSSCARRWVFSRRRRSTGGAPAGGARARSGVRSPGARVPGGRRRPPISPSSWRMRPQAAPGGGSAPGVLDSAAQDRMRSRAPASRCWPGARGLIRPTCLRTVRWLSRRAGRRRLRRGCSRSRSARPIPGAAPRRRC